jgi:hypothetical protein
MPPKGKPATKDPEPILSGLAADLIEALQDSRVIDALGKSLAPLIALSVEESLKKHLESLSIAVRELKADNVRLAKQCESTVKENERLQKVVDVHSRRLDDIESYSRSDNLIIRGLPERSAAERASDAPPLSGDRPNLRESHESVEATALEFFNSTLGVKVSPQDISIAHRIKAGPKEKIRPIIVRFNNRKTRIAVLRAKKTLKDATDKIYISEHLTKTASDLFFTARKLLREKKVFGTWTQNGQVFVRFSPDPSTRASLVACEADLTLKS